MDLVKHLFFSFFATVGFAMIFHAPKKSIYLSGICGSIGWTSYVLLKKIGLENTGANFFASIIIGLLGEIFARIDKKPVSVFVIPGTICLVPGYGIYNTMINMIDKNYQQAIAIGLETIFVAGAIATGIVIVSSIFKVMSKNTMYRKS